MEFLLFFTNVFVLCIWSVELTISLILLYYCTNTWYICTGFGSNFREVDVGEFMWDYSLPGQSTICNIGVIPMAHHIDKYYIVIKALI